MVYNCDQVIKKTWLSPSAGHDSNKDVRG